MAPAVPAPKTMIFIAVGSGGHDRSLAAKATYLAPSIAITAKPVPPGTAAAGPEGRLVARARSRTVRQHAVGTAANATAITSSRLPRRYRPLERPAPRPHPGYPAATPRHS